MALAWPVPYLRAALSQQRSTRRLRVRMGSPAQCQAIPRNPMHEIAYQWEAQTAKTHAKAELIHCNLASIFLFLPETFVTHMACYLAIGLSLINTTQHYTNRVQQPEQTNTSNGEHQPINERKFEHERDHKGHPQTTRFTSVPWHYQINGFAINRGIMDSQQQQNGSQDEMPLIRICGPNFTVTQWTVRVGIGPHQKTFYTETEEEAQQQMEQ